MSDRGEMSFALRYKCRMCGSKFDVITWSSDPYYTVDKALSDAKLVAGETNHHCSKSVVGLADLIGVMEAK